jgi:hypothetical protein
VATADVMTFVLVFMETNGFAQKFCGQTWLTDAVVSTCETQAWCSHIVKWKILNVLMSHRVVGEHFSVLST